MLQQSAAKGFLAVHWLAVLLGTVYSDCVDDGVCAYHNWKHYKTLDGTLRDSNSYGCQSSYLTLPDSWEIAGWDNDGRQMATSYNWGTAWITHSSSCTSCYSGTKMYGGRRRYPSLRIYTSTSNGETTYRPSSCNSRILIRRLARVNCSVGQGLPLIEVGSLPQCSECITGRFSDGGVDVACLPMVAHAASELTSTPPFDFYAESDGFGIVRLGVSTVAPPEALYEGVSMEYSIDIKPNETALDMRGASACQLNKWSSIIDDNFINFTSVLTYSDLNKDCELNLTIVEDKVKREGIAAVALILKDAVGAFEGTVMTWYFPVLIELPAFMEAIYNKGVIAAGGGQLQSGVTYVAKWAGSTLELFESSAFQSRKTLPIYQAGDKAFAELTLIDSDGLILTPVQAWISSSRDPSQGMLHNLTDSIVFIGHGTAGSSQARFSVVLQPCVNCYLHIAGDITSRRLEGGDVDDGEERQLELSAPQHTKHSVPITVEETSSLPVVREAVGGGSEEDSVVLAAVMAGAGVLAALLIGFGACLFMRRCKGELKYKPASTHDPEATPAPPHPAPAAPAPAAAMPRDPEEKGMLTVASI